MNKQEENSLLTALSQLTTKAQELIECPLCYESDRTFVQCTIGHHVCNQCRKSITLCPLCRSTFTETKPFLANGIGEILKEIEMVVNNPELHNINHDTKSKKLINAYRDLVKKVLQKTCDILLKFKEHLLHVDKYVTNPDEHKLSINDNLKTLTEDFTNITIYLKHVESTLNNLKMQI